MIINSLSSLTFRSTGTANKNDKMYIRTPKDYSAFIKKYEPMKNLLWDNSVNWNLKNSLNKTRVCPPYRF